MSGARNRNEYAGGAAARYLLLGAVVFLTAFGLVMIYSASSISALVKQGSSAYYLERQLVFIVVGVLLATFLSRFDYRLLKGKLGYRAWWAIVSLLVLTYAVGVARNGSRRWVPMGFFNPQPSEFAKIACVVVAALLTIEWQHRKLDTPTYLKRLAVYVAVPATLIVFQPDLGTAVLLALGVGIVLVVGGINLKWVFSAVGALVAFGLLFIAIEPYRLERVRTALNPWSDPLGSGYQSVQALLAFGSGGLKGVGLGLSRQKWFYLPESHTDFIFAMVGEEAGLIGTVAVVLGFAVLLYAGMRIAVGSHDKFGRLLASALTGMLVCQAVLNMCAVTGILPVTGKPLPFLSYGGSSMLVTMMSIGLILSVSQYGAHAPRLAKPSRRKHEVTDRRTASGNRTKERTRADTDERRRNSGTRVPRAGSGGAVRRSR